MKQKFEALRALVQRNKVAVVGGSLLGSLAMAHADTGPDTTVIVAAGVSVGVIGAAVFAVRVGIKSWHWMRAAL